MVTSSVHSRGLGLAVGLVGLTVALLAACDGDSRDGCEYRGRHYERGQVFPAGDDCNQCMCTALGAECSLVACADAGPAPDADLAACTPSGGCAGGRACEDVCCRGGERCADGVCQCGSAAGCELGDSCEAAGPVGEDGCGQICCGASGPCPQ